MLYPIELRAHHFDINRPAFTWQGPKIPVIMEKIQGGGLFYGCHYGKLLAH